MLLFHPLAVDRVGHKVAIYLAVLLAHLTALWALQQLPNPSTPPKIVPVTVLASLITPEPEPIVAAPPVAPATPKPAPQSKPQPAPKPLPNPTPNPTPNPNPTPVQEYDATQPVRSFINPIGHQTSPMLPVVGWLVCIDGPSKGRDYRIHSQNNFIGRSRSMDICIEGDNTISSERSAVLSYDDMNRIFYFAPGQSLNLVRLNGNALMMPMELHAYDELTIGKTKLLFVPLCGERFDWNGR